MPAMRKGKRDHAREALTVEGKQRVWEAAYAAAMVQDFSRHYDTAFAENSFDRAAEGMNAEMACEIADQAVENLRQWVEEGRG